MRYARFVAFIALAAGLSACSSGGSNGSYNPYTPSGGSSNASNPSKTYVLTSQVSVPNVPPKSGTWSFDISFVDPAASEYYLADRTNAGVDVISTLNNNAFLGVAGAGSFVGLAAAGSNFSGPNGVAPIGNGNVMAGDGNSTIKVVNINSFGLVASINAVNPVTGAAPAGLVGNQCATATATTGAANGRSDELAYDPTDKEVLIINDVACPAFGTFISTTPPFNVLGSIAFTTATAGAEQPVWDPTQGKFLMAIPATTANPGGEVDVIDPKSFAITKVLPEPSNCQGNGLALGASENLFIGCSNVAGPLVIMNAATGATIATISGSGGCDEVWYNPTANRFYAACSNYTPGPNLAVVDASTNTLIAAPATSTGAHSVAVDPATDKVFVPQRAGGFNAVTIISH